MMLAESASCRWLGIQCLTHYMFWDTRQTAPGLVTLSGGVVQHAVRQCTHLSVPFKTQVSIVCSAFGHRAWAAAKTVSRTMSCSMCGYCGDSQGTGDLSAADAAYVTHETLTGPWPLIWWLRTQ
jgi:hypothetical protein